MRGIPATVARRGYPDAWAIYLKINLGSRAGCTVLAPTRDYERERTWWRPATGEQPVPEADADAYIERECRIDPDLWVLRSEEHTSELQSLMRIPYAVFCSKKKTTSKETNTHSRPQVN